MVLPTFILILIEEVFPKLVNLSFKKKVTSFISSIHLCLVEEYACREPPGCPVPHGGPPRFPVSSSKLGYLRVSKAQQEHSIVAQVNESTCEVRPAPRLVPR